MAKLMDEEAGAGYRALEIAPNTALTSEAPGDDVEMPSLPRHLVPRTPADMTREDLVAIEQNAQRDVRRYEAAVSIATTVLGERRQ